MKLIKNALTPPLAAISALFAFALSASAAFNYKSEMTVQGYSGTTTLTNFPVLVRLSPERISGFTYARCQPDGKDIQFTSTDGETVYPHEIDTWDTTGESLVWVNIPRLSGTDTAFTFWFGDQSVVSAPAGSAVWASANGGFYAGVWHLGEEATAETAMSVINVDSAKHESNKSMNLTPLAGKPADPEEKVSVTGMVGRARQNGLTSSSAITGNGLRAGYRPTSLSGFTKGQFTFSTWLKINYYSIWTALASTKTEAARTGWWLKINSKSLLSISGDGNTADVNATMSTDMTQDGWFHLTVVVDQKHVCFYRNGALVAEGDMGAAPTADYSLFSLGQGPYRTAASYDEARILTTNVSADWAKAEYETASDLDYVAMGAARRIVEDSFVVTADPELLGTVVPAYGSYTEFNTPVLCSAPDGDVAISDTMRISFCGWELYRADADDRWQLVDSAATNQLLYVHEPGTSDKLVWKIRRKYPLQLSTNPTGSGSFLVDGVAATVGTYWFDENQGTLTIAPVAAHGFDFCWWGGSRYGSTNATISVSVAPGVVTSVEASFLSNGEGHTPVTVGWGGGSGSWLDGANWVGGIVPQKGDTVLLTNVSARTITLTDPLPRFAKLVITNSTLIVSNWMSRISADEIVVGQGGTIKTSGWFTNAGPSNRVWLVGNTLTVAPNGKILADEAGYQGNNGPCWAGVALRGREACGIYGGGYGGNVNYPAKSYGSVREPDQPGSGPGTSAATDAAVGAGGGAIRLDFTGDVTVDGRVSAIARHNEVSVYGSGGAIWITCRTISGSGTVDACGGAASTVRRYAGGGGRIAVHYNPSAQSNAVCKVVFNARGGVSYEQVKANQSYVPGESVLHIVYGRSAEDLCFAADPGSLFFTDNQFLFSSDYRAMGLPLSGAWNSDEPLGKIVFDGDLAVTNACLQFLTPHEVVFNGNLSIVGSGYYARRWYGLIFSDSDVTVKGNLTAEGARLELRGGDLSVEGDVEQLSLVKNAGSGAGAYTTKYAGGEIALKASPTNAPGSYGATLQVAKTWHMAQRAVTAVFANPTNGAVVKLSAKDLVLDEGATIDAAEKGWAMNRGPGTSGSTGASYGGRGGTNETKTPPEPYGSAKEPVDPGSGGYSVHTHAGYDGGGVVLLDVARRFEFNGTVTADGNTCCAGTYALGSSGGTVNIRAGRLTGTTGKIRAQGGFCGPSGVSHYGKPGGGGRIAVRYGATDWTAEMKSAATCVLPGGASGDVTNNFGAESGTVYWGTLAIGTMLIVK